MTGFAMIPVKYRRKCARPSGLFRTTKRDCRRSRLRQAVGSWFPQFSQQYFDQAGQNSEQRCDRSKSGKGIKRAQNAGGSVSSKAFSLLVTRETMLHIRFLCIRGIAVRLLMFFFI